MTLDENTFERITAQAKRWGVPKATAARRLLLERIAVLEQEEHNRRLEADYRAQHADADELDEAAQSELLGRDYD